MKRTNVYVTDKQLERLRIRAEHEGVAMADSVLAVGIAAGVGAKLLAGGSSGAFKADAINTGDTAWVLAAAALVMIMTPAVGFFYGGMGRSKNVVSVVKPSVVILALVSIQWVLLGDSLAFGKDIGGGLLGGLSFFGLNGVGYAPNPAYAPTIPHLVYMIFQAMFAILTPALIIGSFVERIGNPGQLLVQMVAVVATATSSFVVTFLLLKLLSIMGLRVTGREEAVGLDIAAHGEEGYRILPREEMPEPDVPMEEGTVA